MAFRFAMAGKEEAERLREKPEKTRYRSTVWKPVDRKKKTWETGRPKGANRSTAKKNLRKKKEPVDRKKRHKAPVDRLNRKQRKGKKKGGKLDKTKGDTKST